MFLDASYESVYFSFFLTVCFQFNFLDIAADVAKVRPNLAEDWEQELLKPSPSAVNPPNVAEDELYGDGERREPLINNGIDHVLCAQKETRDVPAVAIFQSLLEKLQKPDELEGRATTGRKIEVKRVEDCPINEFEMNDLYFYWTFFSVFPLGQGIPGKGSLSQSWRDHMLHLGSQQIASNTNLLFLLFNQMSRHAACAGVSMKAKAPGNGGLSSFDAFERFMATPNLDAELHKALANPQSQESKGLLNKILEYVSVAGRLVPFGDGERSQGIITMYSEWRWFGVSFFFNTIAWNDTDSSMACRLATAAASDRNYAAGKDYSLSRDYALHDTAVPPTRAARAQLLSRHPVIKASLFAKMNQAVTDALYCLPCSGDMNQGIKKSKSVEERESKGERVRGIMGVCSCHRTAHEASGRGALHVHTCLKCFLLNSQLLDRLSPYPALVKLAAKVLESMASCEISALHRVHGDFRRRLGAGYEHLALAPISLAECEVPRLTQADVLHSTEKVSFSDFEDVAFKVADNHCRHDTHTFSCHKMRCGESCCRYCYPRSLNPETGPHLIESVACQKARIGKNIVNDSNRGDVVRCVELDESLSPILEKPPLPRDSVVFQEILGLPSTEQLHIWEMRRRLIDQFKLLDVKFSAPGMSVGDLRAHLPGFVGPLKGFASDGAIVDNELGDNALAPEFFQIPESVFKESLLEELRFKNKTVVEFNDVIAVCCRCNNSIQVLGSAAQAKVADKVCQQRQDCFACCGSCDVGSEIDIAKVSFKSRRCKIESSSPNPAHAGTSGEQYVWKPRGEPRHGGLCYTWREIHVWFNEQFVVCVYLACISSN
jgi:hypothetical protein